MLRTTRAVLVTGLLVAVAGTVVGLVEIVANTVYDYSLETDLLHMMDSMRSTCVGNCLAPQQQATVDALIRGVLYIGGFILVTNLIMVGWVVAMRGGRLPVATIKAPRAAGSYARHDGRIDDLRLLLVAGLIGSASDPRRRRPRPLAEWTRPASSSSLLTVVQVVVAGLLVTRLDRALLLSAVLLNVVPLVLWLYSRTLGLPFGPTAGIPESVGLADVLACVLEVAALLGRVLAVACRRRVFVASFRRPPTAARSS